jgi:hypothetical protein
VNGGYRTAEVGPFDLLICLFEETVLLKKKTKTSQSGYDSFVNQRGRWMVEDGKKRIMEKGARGEEERKGSHAGRRKDF